MLNPSSFAVLTEDFRPKKCGMSEECRIFAASNDKKRKKIWQRQPQEDARRTR